MQFRRMTSEVTIRPATPDDLPAIGRLGAMLVREHHGFDPKRFIAPMTNLEQGYATFIGNHLAARDTIVLVADIGGKAAGYVYATVEGFDFMALRGPAGAIQDIVVDPAQREQGIGMKLLVAVNAALAAKGMPRVVLSTAEQNESAQRLFARAGFRRTMIEMTREIEPQ